MPSEVGGPPGSPGGPPWLLAPGSWTARPIAGQDGQDPPSTGEAKVAMTEEGETCPQPSHHELE